MPKRNRLVGLKETKTSKEDNNKENQDKKGLDARDLIKQLATGKLSLDQEFISISRPESGIFAKTTFSDVIVHSKGNRRM